MPYTSAQYGARPFYPVALATNVGTMTATASGQAVTNSAVAALPEFTRRTLINKIKVQVVTAPGAGATTVKLIFKNGTSTFAVATIGTNTAGVIVAPAITAANAVITRGTAPTVDALGTSTASANTALGLYSFYFEDCEQYDPGQENL